jgi:hypothetical protein
MATPTGRSYLPPETPEIQPSMLALYALGAGVAGWSLIPFFGGLAAIILGHKARLEIAKSGGKLTLDNLAVIGLVLGYSNLIAVACGIIFTAGFFLIPAMYQLLTR